MVATDQGFVAWVASSRSPCPRQVQLPTLDDLSDDSPVGMIDGVNLDTPLTDQPTIASAAFLQPVAALRNAGGRGRSSLLAHAFNAWGFNFAGSVLLTEHSKIDSQIVFNEGIAAPTAIDQGTLLPMFGWMIGGTIDWTDQLSSNVTYAENSLDNTPLQSSDDLHQTTYLAANLIWSPLQRVKVGIEYLYGTRVNVDTGSGHANRVQTAVIFDLP